MNRKTPASAGNAAARAVVRNRSGMRILPVLAVALSVAGCATTPSRHHSQTVAVRISSLDVAWASKGLFIGTAVVYPESIVVVFDSTHVLQVELEAGRSSYHLDSLTVSLASQSGRSWEVTSTSASFAIPDSLSERVSFSPGKVRFMIPRQAGQPITDRWLLVTFHQRVIPSIVPFDRQGGSMTYAHSARTIFNR
jgi:hypothetical protein